MSSGGAAPRIVVCPTCKGPSRFAPNNRWRPFCSERCRSIDLGAWASESYRVETEPPADEEPPATSPDPDTD